MKEYVADFETTQIREYVDVDILDRKIKVLDTKNSRAFVCAWCVGDVETQQIIKRGRTIEEFIEYIKTLQKCNIFFHNLKFDGSFIIYEVLQNKRGKIANEVRDDSLYSFEYLCGKNIRIIFRDSEKIFPCGVEKLGILYDIPKLIGEWDYDKYRDENTEITEDEWKYVEHDVLIVCTALHDYRSRGFTENTISSIAYQHRLKMTYKYFDKNKAGFVRQNKGFEAYKKCLPFDIQPLDDKTYMELILAYNGGWNWLNPLYESKLLSNVYNFDENSMFADKQANWYLPVGQPEIIENPTEEDIKRKKMYFNCIIYKIEHLSIKLKSEKHIPMMMFDTVNEAVRCQGKVIECNDEEVYLTNYDYEMMINEYNIGKKAKITKLFCFVSMKGQYRKFVEYWHKIKEENSCFEKAKDDQELIKMKQNREVAKLMLCSAYGKDGTKIVRKAKTTQIQDDVLTSSMSLKEIDNEYYLPSAIFITSSARYELYSAIKLIVDEFIYSDTDSIKCTEKGAEILKQHLDIHQTKLGSWKIESISKQAKFIRQKTYALYDGNEWKYTVCGATDDMKQLFKIEEFKRGMVITLSQIHQCKDKNGRQLHGKLTPVNVKGGVILIERPFKIDDYEDVGQIIEDTIPIEKFITYMKGNK